MSKSTENLKEKKDTKNINTDSNTSKNQTEVKNKIDQLVAKEGKI